MSLRIKIAALFTATLLIGYFTGVHTTSLKYDHALQQAVHDREQAEQLAIDINERLESLCGEAVLKFIPCKDGLEVCVCGEPNNYLKKQK